jgi:hypothetical protein
VHGSLAAVRGTTVALARLEEGGMIWNKLAGEWLELKKQIRAQLAEPTDEVLDTLAERREALAERLQRYYSVQSDETERPSGDFSSRQ